MAVSIHAPLARSNFHIRVSKLPVRVSIHAPLARSNLNRWRYPMRFNVSIHAPLARSNTFKPVRATLHASFNTCSSCEEQRGGAAAERLTGSGFNTCSSCEEQLQRIADFRLHQMFQYMLLLRGATVHLHYLTRRQTVSIHAPLARSN